MAVGNRITCTSVSRYDGMLTRGQRYEIVAEDIEKRLVRVRSDQGRIQWFPDHCFTMGSEEVPTLVRWKFDDFVKDETNDWVDVSFELSDRTRRWCSMVTPARLQDYFEQPDGDRGVWGTHVIVVRSLTADDVGFVIGELDRQGELIECSLVLPPPASAGEPDPKSLVPPELFG